MLYLKILIFMSEIQLNNNFSNLSYPVLTKNCISSGRLWYNINCIFEILQQIHQKALQIRQYKEKTALHEATWLSCSYFDTSYYLNHLNQSQGYFYCCGVKDVGSWGLGVLEVKGWGTRGQK